VNPLANGECLEFYTKETACARLICVDEAVRCPPICAPSYIDSNLSLLLFIYKPS